MKLAEYLERHQLGIWSKILVDYESNYVGWGRKKSFFKAQSIAAKKHSEVLCLEDGFIRSLGLGKEGYLPLSIVADKKGIYFDATGPSDLENFIQQEESLFQNNEAKKIINKILEFGITKYNQKFLTLNKNEFDPNKKHILVVDQTFGDQSIKYAGASTDSFKKMLQKAHQCHPDAIIWIKTHPDVMAGKAKSNFSKADLSGHNIRIIAENYNPIELLQLMDEVYVVSSQLGFEALLCQKKVHCFGVPWYAGWGLTNDQYAPIDILQGRRGVKRSLTHLFASAYLRYALYLHPVTEERCECEDIIDLFVPNIEFQKHLNSSYIAYSFSPWKKRFIRDFMDFPNTKITFKYYFKPNKSDHIFAWGKKAQTLKLSNYPNVTTVEDGFIRSVGLGAKLIRPYSLVFDDVGIYYDATMPSRIEKLLNTLELTDDQLLRARRLQQQLIYLNISKYNVGNFKSLIRPNVDRVLLVVGQVEDDMSIQLGGIDIRTNLELLKRVRENHQDAYIIYKPHPDVTAGLRVGAISELQILKYADRIEYDASILELFEIIDELHTITSLSGFEALLRNIKVYCYGMPFYAGWGLTHDIHKSKRRSRNVNLETLIYVTLVEYPMYNLPQAAQLGLPVVRPEDVITYIKNQLDQMVNNKDGHNSKVVSLYNLIKKLG